MQEHKYDFKKTANFSAISIAFLYLYNFGILANNARDWPGLGSMYTLSNG